MSHVTLQKNIFRLMALLLTIMLLLPCVPIAYAEGGSCGSSLSWSFEGNTLTITGSGAMIDYSLDNPAPWFGLRGEIYQLSLPDGLTRVGDLAFYDCINLSAVALPGSVTDVGELAFCQNRSMTMLSLNNGLRTIGRSTFERCESLKDLRIPSTVTSVGKHAFYVCTSLQYVTVPSSVTIMGSGVFGYCSKLVRVDVDADIDEIPFGTFLGCDNLNTVTLDGESLNVDLLTSAGVSSGNQYTSSHETLQPGGNTVESSDITVGTDGNYHISGTTTTKTENTTISIVDNIVVGKEGETNSADTDVDISLTNQNGWSEVVEQIQSAQGTGQTENKDKNTDVTVYVPDNSVVPEGVMKDLAGSNVNLSINTSSGSKFKIDCSVIEAENIDSDLDLSYTLTSLVAVPEGIESNRAYQLTFNNSCNIKVEVMIRLPQENVRRAASLYQFGEEKTYDFIQSVVVDNDSYAHYYLASVDKNVQYLIAMDVKGEQSAQAIVPDELKDEYRLVDHSTGKEYVITGRKSSWNMGLGKVMAILAVVMVSAIGVIGFVMYFWNKQRLKNGYVPQWEDEDNQQ